MRKRTTGAPLELNMTAMIDVVFLLLIFFLATTQPGDVLAHFEVLRPALPESTPKPPPPLVRIAVRADGFDVQGRAATDEQMDRLLKRLAGLDPGQSLLLLCDPAAPHERLIQALDRCARHGLTNLSVLSVRNGSPAYRVTPH